jgi:phosphoheptose isomerase
MKNFKKHRKFDKKMLKALQNEPELLNGLEPGLPAISLVSQTSLITAYLNDHDPNFIYAQQVSIYGQEGDILIAISTSGNSKNCVNAAKVAKALNLKVISLTGMKESEISKISDATIKVPETETYKVQERHLPIYHALCAMIEEELF